MKTPKDWERYQSQMLRKFETLCDSNIWHLTTDNIYYWLANFKKNREHEYLAYEMLDSMTHRNKLAIEASYHRFLVSEFRHITREFDKTVPSEIDTWLEQLSSKEGFPTNNVRLSPVRMQSDMGDSSQSVVRLLNSKLISEQRKLILDENSYKTVKGYLILLVDDFAGSGNQFGKFAKKIQLNRLKENNTIIYAPAMGMSAGVEKIKTNWGIEVFPLESVNKSHSIFEGSNTDQFRNNNNNTIKEALQCYDDMKNAYGYVGGSWLGYKKAKLVLSFDWGCPNQTLGIFWDGKNFDRDWNVLLTRRA